MTEEQTNKLIDIISTILIPNVFELQNSKLYPEQFSFHISHYDFIIENNEIFLVRLSLSPGGRLRHDEAPRIRLDLKELRKWDIPGHSLANIDYKRFLKILSEKLVSFIKEAEIYQNDIKDIFHFANTISLPLFRTVILEKHKIF